MWPNRFWALHGSCTVLKVASSTSRTMIIHETILLGVWCSLTAAYSQLNHSFTLYFILFGRQTTREGLCVQHCSSSWLIYRRLELEPIGRARGLVVLQIDSAARCRRRQVDVVLGEQLLVLGHPVAEDVRVVGGDNGDLCTNETKTKPIKNRTQRQRTSDLLLHSPRSLSSHVCFASSSALYTSRLGSVPEKT